MKRNALLVLALLALVAVGIAVWPRDSQAPPSASLTSNSDFAEPPPSAPAELLNDIEEPTDRIPAAASEVRPAADTQPKLGSPLVIEVRSSTGTAVPSARVVFVRSEKVLAKRSTGKDGRVSVYGLGSDVDVFVVTGRVIRVRRHLDEAEGSHVLVFPHGTTLRGTVLVNGVPAKTSVVLTLRLNDASGLELAPAFGQLRPQLPDGIDVKPYLTAWTGSAGYFEFADVPPSCTGTLEIPSDYWWENDADPLEIHDLTQELVIRLETPPAITGRIVKPGTRDGAPYARISYEMPASSRRDGMTFSGDSMTNSGGRFRLEFPRRKVLRFVATIHLEGVGQTTLDIRDVPATGLDLGDIALVEGNEVHFVVRDTDGAPIRHAIASTLDDPPLKSQPTDASGKGQFASLPPTLNSIRFRALGYRSVTRSVDTRSATESSPIAVTLERLPQLDVVVQQSDGTPAREVVVRLSCRDTAPFVAEDGDGSRPIQLDLGAVYPEKTTQSGPNAPREFHYAVDEKGQVQIFGLNPEARFVVRVSDKTRTTLVERSVGPALLRSKEPILIVLDGLTRTLELQIVDANRNPIAGAQVSFDKDGLPLAKSQSDGIARITPVYGSHVDLTVFAAGFAPTPVREVALAHELERRDVVMMRGYSIRVRVVDTDGKEMAATDVYAAQDFHSVGTVSHCPDEPCFLVEDLPSEPIQLFVNVMGASLFREHDPRNPVALVKVPEHGSVMIEFSEPITDPDRCSVSLVPSRNEDGTVPEENGNFTQMSGKPPVHSLLLPLVFPGRYTVEVDEMNFSSGEHLPRSRIENVTVRTGERTVVRAIVTR